MANIERGTRIKERREELHLTQPAVVDLLEQAAGALPETHDLHPAKAGKAPVTLRGYQSYEQGGGIVWEKAKLLAQVLQMDVQAMMNGETETAAPTPEPFGETQLDRIERLLGGLDLRITELEKTVNTAFVGRSANAEDIVTRLEAVETAVEQAVVDTGGELLNRLAALEDAISGRVDASGERFLAEVLQVLEEHPPDARSATPKPRAPKRSGTRRG